MYTLRKNKCAGTKRRRFTAKGLKLTHKSMMFVTWTKSFYVIMRGAIIPLNSWPIELIYQKYRSDGQ
ncbi:MAG: hypothetical protein EA377_02735 [Phycisphaerales bacterium]|nr:MAG: hypothetical protein EA377_02735 [Phycisphaerales bacterium]